jgi:putative flippase GtrA
MTTMWRRQIFSYLSVGVLSAIVDIGTLQLLRSQGLNDTLAVSIGFFVGLLFNYTCQRSFTFRSRHTMLSLLRYLSVVALNYLLTLACTYLSIVLLDSPLPGKIASLPMVALVGFFTGKYWIFAAK